MMVVAIYVHVHPGIPVEILPMGFKPLAMPITYILLVIINLYLNRNSPINIREKQTSIRLSQNLV